MRFVPLYKGKMNWPIIWFAPVFLLLASIPVLQSFLCAVSPPEPRPLRQDELQLWSGSSSYQGPDQGQRVLVEVSLK